MLMNKNCKSKCLKEELKLITSNTVVITPLKQLKASNISFVFCKMVDGDEE